MSEELGKAMSGIKNNVVKYILLKKKLFNLLSVRMSPLSFS